MPTNTTLPDEDDLQQIVLEGLPAVLTNIAAANKKRRKRRISIAAVSVGVVGVAIAAAALAPLANPDNGIDIMGPRGSAFAIDCYSSMTVKATVMQYQTTDDANKVVADPAAACTGQAQRNILETTISNEVDTLSNTGATCGIINITDHGLWTWSTDGSGGTTTSQGTVPKNWPAKCDVTTTIPAPAIPATALVTCARASNWAVVYPQGQNTAKTICSSRGYQVWGQ